MKHKRYLFILLIPLFIVLIFTIQAFLDLENEPESVIIHASWPKRYESIQELSNDCDIAAVVKVLNIQNTFLLDNKVPMTNFEVEVVYNGSY